MNSKGEQLCPSRGTHTDEKYGGSDTGASPVYMWSSICINPLSSVLDHFFGGVRNYDVSR